MGKPTKDSSEVKDKGAPSSLILSLLVGFPVLGAIIFYSIITGSGNFLPIFTWLAILVQGLGLCFYWRRLSDSSYKRGISSLFVAILWLYMGAIIAGAIASIFTATGNFLYVVSLITLAISAIVGLLFTFLWGIEKKARHRLGPLSLAGVGVIGVLILLVTPKLTPDSSDEGGVVLSADSKEDRFEAVSDEPSYDASIPNQKPHSETHQPSQHPKTATPKEASVTDNMVASQRNPPYHKPLHDDGSLGNLKGHMPQHSSNSTGMPQYPQHNRGTPWGYHGNIGPKYWGGLKREYVLCGTGVMQSPVNIIRNSRTTRSIKFKYLKSSLQIINTGHTIKVNPDRGSSISMGGRQYHLMQFHFHNPSEHTINGIYYPLEIHFVHQNRDHQTVVLGVLVEQGSRNKEIDKIWHFLPRAPGQKQIPRAIYINPYNLLPRDKKAYSYMGSLTTPPCNEGVAWHLFKHPIQLSYDQIEAFKSIYSGNNRPVQPLHNREVGKKFYTGH